MPMTRQQTAPSRIASLDDLAREWFRVRPLVLAALAEGQGEYQARDVFDGVAKGLIQLWAGERSMVITQVSRYPRYRALQAIYGAGDLEEIKAGLPTLLAFAKEQGCVAVLVFGRDGWARALGGKKVSTITRLEVD